MILIEKTNRTDTYVTTEKEKGLLHSQKDWLIQLLIKFKFKYFLLKCAGTTYYLSPWLLDYDPLNNHAGTLGLWSSEPIASESVRSRDDNYRKCKMQLNLRSSDQDIEYFRAIRPTDLWSRSGNVLHGCDEG